MKKIIYFLYLILSLQHLVAQGGNPEGRARMMEKLEAQRVAFITNKLDLSSEESSKFWPLYNDYSRQRMDLKKARFANRKSSDPEDSIEDEFDKEEQVLKLKKIYYEKFRSAIPVSKIARLDDVEKEFRFEVIKVLKQRRMERNR